MLKKIIQINRNITQVFVDYFNKFFGSISDWEIYFYNQFNSSYQDSTVLEIGGTSRPIFQKEHIGEYIGLDIDENFNYKDKYHKYFVQSCEDWNESISADLIFSKYLLEHVPNNYRTFENIEKWLSPGGISAHVFPLGYHPFSLSNRLVGNRIAKWLIPILRPGTEAITGYPAYYHLCNSFALSKLKRESKFKYEVKYFYGAEDYFGFFFPFAVLLHLFNRVCHLFSLHIFASNAVLIIKK